MRVPQRSHHELATGGVREIDAGPIRNQPYYHAVECVRRELASFPVRRILRARKLLSPIATPTQAALAFGEGHVVSSHERLQDVDVDAVADVEKGAVGHAALYTIP